MAPWAFDNNAQSTTTSSLNNTQLTIPLVSSSVFAELAAGGKQQVVMVQDTGFGGVGASKYEFVLCNGNTVGTNTLAVAQRGFGGTTAQNFVNGALVTAVVSKEVFEGAYAFADRANTGDILARGFQAGGVTVGLAPFQNNGRYLGVSTSTGPPTTGTFNTGDYGHDNLGVMYFCYAGGTPGTWRAITGEVHWSRFIFAASGGTSVPSPDTTLGGDIVLPAGFAHAKIIWRARDQSATATAAFGGMQWGVAGGAIDQGLHYNWTETVDVQGAAPVGGGGLNVGAMDPIVTAGGGDGSGATGHFAQGEINIPFYSLSTSGRPNCFWTTIQPNPGSQIVRNGSGVYWFAVGPLTKVHFFSGNGNFENGTTFDLYLRPN